MKYFMLILNIFLILFLSCQKKPTSNIYQLHVYLLQGSRTTQETVTPFFPGETSIRFIENAFRTSEEVRSELVRTFGYQQIDLVDVISVSVNPARRQTHYFVLSGFYLRIKPFPQKEGDTIPLSINLTSADKITGKMPAENYFRQHSSFFAVRADVPVEQGLILGRPLPDSSKALFLVLQPAEISGELKIDERDGEAVDEHKPAGQNNVDSPISPENIAEFYALTVKPEVVTKVEPRYPEDARKSGWQGMVIIKILINEAGRVGKAEIIKNSEFASLDSAAVTAARKFEFKPGEVDGKPVKVWMTVPFTFRLKK